MSNGGVEIEPGALHARKVQALEVARARRRQLSLLREAIAAGELDPIDLIRGSDDAIIEECVASAKLSTFLPMIRGIGKAKAMEITAAFRATPNMRIGQFSAERRLELAYIVKSSRDSYFG